MTFLEICQKVRDKVGVSGTGPSTTVAQAGSLLRIVNCVIEAWKEIQDSSPHWKFMVKDGTLALTNTTQTYSLATIVGALPLYGKPIPGTLKFSDGARVSFKSWAQWDAENIDLGVLTGRPDLWTEDSDLALRFYKIPDASYTLRFRYRRATQVLAANADVPCCPVEFHMAIVYRAALLYAGQDEANDLIAVLAPEYRVWISKLERSELPKLTHAPSGYRSPR